MHNDQSGVSVHAGFPNPATDTSLRGLDLNQLLIKHGASTYLMRARGGSWVEEGIFNNDIVIIDRVLKPQLNDLVSCWYDNSFTISRFSTIPKTALIWGVVVATIHQYRKSS